MNILAHIHLTYLENWEAGLSPFVSYEKYATIWNSLNDNKYCKVKSFNTSSLEAHEGFFRLLMKVILDLYVSTVGTVTFWQKDDSLISNAC